MADDKEQVVNTFEDMMAVLERGEQAAMMPRLVTVKKFGSFFVRPLLVEEVDEENSVPVDVADKTSLARGVLRLVCDQNGKRLSDANNKSAIQKWGKQSWDNLLQLLNASRNAAGEDAEKK